ncbi:TolC family protein [Desulfoluna sp.]|uniref:TolC family protein n=1 Tax=Desulfoluna sp. TaxID=2045199 RepID=UPI0026158F9A|nr:TolC family protein [Desulfoluna sp.]
MKRFLVLTALCLAASPLHALTLPELQQEALAGRHSVKAASAQAAIADKKVQEARSPFLPSVDVGYKANRYNHDTILKNQEKNDAFQGSISLNLFAGFSDSYTLKAAKSGAEAGQFNLKSTRQDVSQNVALAYLGVYRSRQNLKVAEDAVRLYRDRYREMELKYKVGVLKKRDLLSVKVEMDNAVQTERRTRANITSALNTLALTVGRPLTEEEITALNFSLFKKIPTVMEAEAGKATLLSRNSDLLSLKETLTGAAMQKKAARAAYMPRVDLSATYSSLYLDDYSFGSSDVNGDDVRLTASVSMNLFDGLKKEATISQAALTETALRHQLRELENSLTTRFDNAILDRDVAIDNLGVAQSGLNEAEENLRITDLAFAQGVATSTEVLDAIFNLSRARFNHISAQTDVFATHFTLLRLTEGYETGHENRS